MPTRALRVQRVVVFGYLEGSNAEPSAHLLLVEVLLLLLLLLSFLILLLPRSRRRRRRGGGEEHGEVGDERHLRDEEPSHRHHDPVGDVSAAFAIGIAEVAALQAAVDFVEKLGLVPDEARGVGVGVGVGAPGAAAPAAAERHHLPRDVAHAARHERDGHVGEALALLRHLPGVGPDVRVVDVQRQPRVEAAGADREVGALVLRCSHVQHADAPPHAAPHLHLERRQVRREVAAVAVQPQGLRHPDQEPRHHPHPPRAVVPPRENQENAEGLHEHEVGHVEEVRFGERVLQPEAVLEVELGLGGAEVGLDLIDVYEMVFVLGFFELDGLLGREEPTSSSSMEVIAA